MVNGLEHSIPQEHQCYYNQTPKRFLSEYVCVYIFVCLKPPKDFE